MTASEWNPLHEPNGFLFGKTTEWYPGQNSGSMVSATNGFPFGGSGFQSAIDSEFCAFITERLDTMNSLLVPENKVNLAENDIEDWLYEHPGEIRLDYITIERWLARQYRLPSGIADLIGKCTFGAIVVEIKNVPINKAAVLQVCRYAADIEAISTYRNRDDTTPANVFKLLIGPSIDGQTFDEARACGVFVNQFQVHFHLTNGPLKWTHERLEGLRQQYDSIAKGEEWNIFGTLDEIEDIPMEMSDEEIAEYLPPDVNPYVNGNHSDA